MAVPEPRSFVPPHASAKGLDAGKSTCGFPSRSLGFRISDEPSSPEEQQTVTPSAAASSRARLKALSACGVLSSSVEPQLIEITEGLRTLSCRAVLTAARKPLSVFRAKYTAIFALGATAPATSMSSMTSPSAFGSFPGRLAPTPPSLPTPTAVTSGIGNPSDLKYALRSLRLNPVEIGCGTPASIEIEIVQFDDGDALTGAVRVRPGSCTALRLRPG